MKRFAAIAALVALLGTTATAQAKDAGGMFGVGFNQSLTSGSSGLGLNYWIGYLKLGAILGLTYFSPEEGDSEFDFRVSIHGLYAIARSNDANLNFGLRVNILIDQEQVGTESESGVGFQIELPIEGEYWLSDHFSIYGHVGLVVDIVSEDYAKLSPTTRTQGFGIDLGTGGFSGGVGFNFYF